MLHLLDPGAYRLSDREAFQQRVKNRASVADAVAQLTDEAPAMFLEDAVAQLEQAFGDDPPLRALTGNLSPLVEEDVSSTARVRAIRALRSHATETYKLHRRLLRTRRDDPSVQHLLATRQGLDRLPCDDSPRRLAWDLVEEWRRALPVDEQGRPPFGAAPTFAEFVEAALSHPVALAKRFRMRGDAAHDSTGPGKPAHASFWSDEARWCARASETLAQAVDIEPRADALAEWIANSNKKAIIFVDDPDVASRVASTLQQALGRTSVLLLDPATPTGGAEVLSRFMTEADVRAIVADRSAEEGLNLQGTRAVLVHYDLPFAPTRIEQRNGRIDRLEAMGSPRFLTFEGTSEYELEWIGFLEARVKVFDRTVAPLQYLLAASCQRLREHLVSRGPHAFAAEGAVLEGPGGLEDELRIIRQQEGLDSLSLTLEADDAFFSAMCESDEEASVSDGADCEEWLCRRLNLSRRGMNYAKGTPEFHYEYALANRPLLPLHAVVTNLEQSIDSTRSRPTFLKLGPFTYDRESAIRAQGVRLLRPGNPFLDGVENLVRCDDRGAAFAMWRLDAALPPGETRLFFRVEFVVQVGVTKARKVVDEAGGASDALRRLADSAFPPVTRHIWVDSDCRRVTAEPWLSRLDMPFVQGRDANLRPDRWAFADGACPVHDWSGLCRKAREAAEAMLWDDELTCMQSAAVRRWNEVQAAHRIQWASRIARMPEGATRAAESKAAHLSDCLDEALLAGLQQPSVHVDSMGAVYLSSTSLKDV
jgi:ATP-dependent helicase HepA